MIKIRIFNGMLAMGPILIGLIPFALSVGVFGTEKGLAVWQSVALSLIVFAGASQVAMIDLLAQSAPIWIIVSTALLINLRFLVFSATLSAHVKDASPFVRVFLSYTLVDQMLLIINDKAKSDKTYEWVGAGIVTALFWHSCVFIGAYFGSLIPEYLSLKFVLPVLFLFFGVSMLETRAHIVSAITTCLFILLLYPIMPLGSGLMSAIIIGAIAGIASKRINI
ncbi:MAG: AzlC family ABC transporter permease [Pseudomonadota bacterium]